MGKKKKRYVSYTPFIQGKNGELIPINMYSTLEYTEEELLLRLSTDEAINFIENALSEVRKYEGSTLFCDYGYFVEAAFSKSKNSSDMTPPKSIMLDNDLRKITIRVSIQKDGILHYEKKEFVIHDKDFRNSPVKKSKKDSKERI